MDVIDELPDGVLVIDADLVVAGANRAAVTILGAGDAATLIGRSLVEALDPRGRDGKPLLVEGWSPSARLRSVSGIPEQEITVRRGDGGDTGVFVTGSYRRDGDGRLTGAVLVLRAASRRLHQAAAGIEIVSTVSHELRSPLTSVKGFTSLLLNRWDRLGDDQKKMMLEQVNHDADRVTRLITELLDISRLETGRLVLRRQMIDLGSLAATVVEKVTMEYPDLDATLAFPEGMPSVYADPDKVEQVLTNLIENACKYATPKGLQVVATVDGRDAAVAVTDAGEGIAADALPRVFEKFFRKAEGKPTGSGLGLWISRGLVEAHGGRLTATSIPGSGTTFRFTLPLDAFEDLHRQ